MKKSNPRKRQWKTRRQLVAHPAGLYRWDQVYQHLLRWYLQNQLNPKEVSDADSFVCQGLKRPASSNSDN
jgi:hypothetical protein